MQLTSFSDYTLRVLIFLAMQPDRRISIREIADAFDLSFDHLSKVAQLLSRQGYVIATRGRGGGMQLARKPEDISIGAVLRQTESAPGVVECLRGGTQPVKCRLAPICCLSGIFVDANAAFFAVLDAQTLADALPDAKSFEHRFGIASEAMTAPCDTPLRP